MNSPQQDASRLRSPAWVALPDDDDDEAVQVGREASSISSTVWWLGTTALMPVVLSMIISYDLTYGSLAGVMLALIFFYIIGLGVVFGAQLNAALAEVPETEIKKEAGDPEDAGEATQIEEP